MLCYFSQNVYGSEKNRLAYKHPELSVSIAEGYNVCQFVRGKACVFLMHR